MARRRFRHAESASDRWVLSYADFITLLFAFFTTLYAMSVTDARKAEDLVQSLRESFGESLLESGAARPGVFVERVTSDAPSVPGAARGARRDLSVEGRTLATLAERTEAIAQDSPLPAAVSVRHSDEGLVISLADSFFFSSGGAAIPPDAERMLAQIAGLLTHLPNHLRIEGHTDDQVVSTRLHPSNWHLSALRAVEVLGVVQRAGVAPYRLAASGFADQRPRVSNATGEGRQLNRRVDIVVRHTRGPERDT